MAIASRYNGDHPPHIPTLMTARPSLPPGQRITMVDAIEALLPQTQCGKCKHPGCQPYADAIAHGESINHCVPGGQDTINALADLLGESPLPLDPAFGITPASRQVAVIRESECIGCTKCIQACPVDAIVGAAKFTHTIIRSECTGCDLCIAPCPVDCIDLIDLPEPLLTAPTDRQEQARHQKARYQLRKARLLKEKTAREQQRGTPPTRIATAPDSQKTSADIVAAALLRSNLKKVERHLDAAMKAGEDTAMLRAEVERLQAKLHQIG